MVMIGVVTMKLVSGYVLVGILDMEDMVIGPGAVEYISMTNILTLLIVGSEWKTVLSYTPHIDHLFYK